MAKVSSRHKVRPISRGRRPRIQSPREHAAKSYIEIMEPPTPSPKSPTPDQPHHQQQACCCMLPTRWCTHLHHHLYELPCPNTRAGDVLLHATGPSLGRNWPLLATEPTEVIAKQVFTPSPRAYLAYIACSRHGQGGLFRREYLHQESPDAMSRLTESMTNQNHSRHRCVMIHGPPAVTL